MINVASDTYKYMKSDMNYLIKTWNSTAWKSAMGQLKKKNQSKKKNAKE